MEVGCSGVSQQVSGEMFLPLEPRPLCIRPSPRGPLLKGQIPGAHPQRVVAQGFAVNKLSR